MQTSRRELRQAVATRGNGEVPGRAQGRLALSPAPQGLGDDAPDLRDLAPTLLELGGAPRPAAMQGKSLAALMKKSGDELRDGFLIEYYSDTVFPRMNKMGYQAVRTRDWKYIHYLHLPGSDELYDMNRDPYEMRNLATSARHQDKLALMKTELANQLRQTNAPKRPE